jgi:hypothetical protein
MTCPSSLSLAVVNASLCAALYLYVYLGIDMITFPPYHNITLYERFTVLLRQAILTIALFASAPYFLNTIMQGSYMALDAMC